MESSHHYLSQKRSSVKWKGSRETSTANCDNLIYLSFKLSTFNLKLGSVHACLTALSVKHLGGLTAPFHIE